MRTVLLGQPPPEVRDLIERRRALGQDLFDEVWEGEYHMAPAPHRRQGEVDDELAAILHRRAKHAGLRGSGPANIGTPGDYRVPDRSYFADRNPKTYNPTAEIVIEIVSPDDESHNKLGFYHKAGVKEVALVDPAARTVEWFSRTEDDYQHVDRSKLLKITSQQLVHDIDWPHST